MRNAEQKARSTEANERNQLYTYIREPGYCPHCELRLRQCLRHGKARDPRPLVWYRFPYRQLVPRPCNEMEFLYGRKKSIVTWLRNTLARDRLSVQFPTFKSMCTVTVYTFRVRDRRTGNWRDSRHKLTTAKADKRYGDGNYEVIESSKEVRLRRLLRKIFKFSK